ncbi:leader peptidase (prepilin peptidase) / N-methyltransferase [Saccharopolyspora antimicrobica]|uniref:Leader peptidase (Prepilin peptidase) / N-methyltransferase n=1 Tax=Saccharopolyspora antimicrobica TaxID=455193 RepID=A0A1I5BF25_9PSEU|nr:A24 family peptidase [Saccharopolyspora antimicrobica]RKT86590.1 leader peptidase (prepilin peptidase)/N-methyltransferase [Saccharopolyspora antimicrobica]SFN73325.1 leader peptidase (prepilin peptidase) / N-methyltransferase [Saccharopolyspora antimicrobica]
MVVVIGIFGGVVGFGAGWFGRLVLGAARRGVVAPRWWCEVGVGVLWAVVAVRVAGGMPWWWAGVPLVVGWGGVLLSVCDIRAYRLPDVFTLPAYPVALLLVGVASVHQPGVWAGAIGGGLLFGGVYLLVRVVQPAAMGPGDVKLAGSLGLVVGAVSVGAVLAVIAAAALGTLVAASRWGRGAIPHGPAALVPAWLVTAFAPWP